MKSHLRECPDPEAVGAYLEGRLGAREWARVTDHLANCEGCYFAFCEAAQMRVAEVGEEQTGWHKLLLPVLRCRLFCNRRRRLADAGAS